MRRQTKSTRDAIGPFAILLRLAWFAILAVVGLAATGLTFSLLLIGLGATLFPASVAWLRAIANRTRAIVSTADGEPFADPYGSAVKPRGFREGFTLSFDLLRDRLLWRDLWWASAFSTAGLLLALIPATLVVYGIFGLLVQPFVWRPIDNAGGSNWYAVVHVDSTATALLAAVLGAVFIVAGFWFSRSLLSLTCRLCRWLLTGPVRARLERRVEHLTDTREAALDTQAAELRRIERDLHDGAQARLVAMGMNLAEADRALDHDPAAARALISEAKKASSDALDELRDLVRGIHPPVLADRGLIDAVRALALDSAVDVEVDGTLPGRPSLPIESAAYFAVSEVLTNAAKHAGRCRVGISFAYEDGNIRVVVRDDGPGGADPARGSGLRGIEKRLAAFDGSLLVDSPADGPTTITMEVPCALSSPKTSSS